MESNDLKANRPDDAQLEAWLRTSASLPSLPDEGFTRDVLAALPPPVQTRVTARALACLAGALVGIGIAVFQFQQTSDLPRFDEALLASLERLSQPTVGLAVGVTLLSLAYVFWSELRSLVRL
jgi:hypothetical protein